jgi:hypothetical protein
MRLGMPLFVIFHLRLAPQSKLKDVYVCVCFFFCHERFVRPWYRSVGMLWVGWIIQPISWDSVFTPICDKHCGWVFEHLSDYMRETFFFEKDSTTAHTTSTHMCDLWSVFGYDSKEWPEVSFAGSEVRGSLFVEYIKGKLLQQ